MSDKQHIKDIPIGVLLIVVSQFFLYGVIYFAKFPLWWEAGLIIFFTLFASRLIDLGINLIRGVDIVKLDK